MTAMPLILILAVVTYLTRVAGFSLAGHTVPPWIDRFLTYVPVAAFAALIASGLGAGTPEIAPRLIAAWATLAVMLRWSRLWAGLTAGMLAYWLSGWWLG
jgi:branched-subunit amino acid transport protein